MSRPLTYLGEYPRGTSYDFIIHEERELREAAERNLNSRLIAIEERMFITYPDNNMLEQFPKLRAAYNRYKDEESKMLTFVALRDK